MVKPLLEIDSQVAVFVIVDIKFGIMKLRELINKLEELSDNGKNDNMAVVYSDMFGHVGIKAAFLNTDTYEIELV